MTREDSVAYSQRHEVTHIRLFNSRGREIELVLEPWGEVYAFRPGDEFTIVFQGIGTASPEVDFGEDAITVYGWPGATAHLLLNGQQFGSQELPEVPAIPRALTMRGFMDSVFGSPSDGGEARE